MVASEGYLGEPWDTELKRTVIKAIKELKLKEDTMKPCKELKNNSKRINAWVTLKNTQHKAGGNDKDNPGLKMEFSKMADMLKMRWNEDGIENPNSPTEKTQRKP